MKRNFERYVKLKRSIQDWLLGQGNIGDIAHPLHITSSSLKELLSWNGLSSIDGQPEHGIDTQDVLNLLFLFYTQSNREVIREKVLKR